ncbi:endo-1,4-beta-xylanase [Glacieibacterium frigidum]|uniref:Endo-1,4-beta-xylanase n=1 Tax=Glacieibacterium frigidum TaxID=2593303 RepID=A0A552UJH3_9SPHN|nr:endo-1,4-beta-xylanase [Glacieibacterium frigidum]
METSKDRVVTNLEVRLPYLGSVRPRSTREISGSNWLLGCETLDRDYADYDQYKEFIAPLGIKRLRMQAGWAKTEKVRAVYDFAWLDRIVDDATGRGFEPWLQTSYGNPIYPGGGGYNLGAGLPVSAEALAAYDRWVAALVTRYAAKVFDWEVWNEPNFGDNTINSPEMTADFNVRTARIIKRIQPRARISGLALGHFAQPFVDRFFKRVADLRGFGLFANMTYHDYAYNPDSNRHEVAQLRAALDRYAPAMPLRQGENGAPSAGGSGRGALWDYPWSELTQAKWDTRRMLGDLGLDIESSVFGLVEMNYTAGPINRLNYKGILKSDASKRVIRPKTAYYAIQHVTSIFDDSLERIRTLKHSYRAADAAPGETLFSYSTDRRTAGFGYRNRKTGKQLYSFWLADNIPAESNEVRLQELVIAGADIDTPVWVDIISGAVHDIPAAQVRRTGNALRLSGVPFYDAPIVVADRSLVSITT